MIEFETKRLILRSWKLSDSSDLYEYGKNELVGPIAGWPSHKSEDESRDIIRMFIKNDDVLAVELKSEHKVIGGIGLHHKIPDEKLKRFNQREIGYVLNPQYWGNGYIPEAVAALIKNGFEKLNLDLIWCGHFEENYKSKRVNEKCGFNYKFKKGSKLHLLGDKPVTIFYYNIYKEDFLNTRSLK